MSTPGDAGNGQDPDYAPHVEADEKQQKLYEENARSNTAKKITAIVEKEFGREIDAKEKEILEIQERLQKALKTLHLLRYVVITDYYNRKQCRVPNAGSESKQTRIHPAVKSLIGKAPRNYDPAVPSTSSDPCSSFVDQTETDGSSSQEKRNLEDDEESKVDPQPLKKIPRYVPPKSTESSSSPSRGVRHKVKKRIVVGNISKWIPPDWREDPASHKWTMYVRGSKEETDISEFVAKVRFFLHPSYRPNDVVEVTSPPFYLSRRGWGEFPLRVQLHFKNPLNKPMDIIHHLKLDRTYTGLQTLGSETIVDLWIHNVEPRLPEVAEPTECKDEGKESIVKEELMEESSEIVVKEETNSIASSVPDLDIVKIETEESCDDQDREFCSNDQIEDNEFVESSGNDEIEKLRLHVELDHDYFRKNASELPETSQITDQTSSEEVNGFDEETPGENVEPIEFRREPIHLPTVTESSKLEPLEISIPPLFVPVTNKQVLLLKNEDLKNNVFSKNEQAPTKLSVILPRKGVSLLKQSQDSKVILKANPSNSLLLDMDYSVPALKIVDDYRKDEHEKKTMRSKVTLGKDKHRIQSRKELYEETLKSIDSAKIDDVEGMLRFIFRRLPFVTKNAADPDYKCLHPYSCVSEEEFTGYNIGKQRYFEWYRAKLARSFLLKRSDFKDRVWNMKEIVVWARAHGYTPGLSNFRCSSVKLENETKKLPSSQAFVSTYTEPDELEKWLQTVKDSKCTDASDEEEIDVVNVEVKKREQSEKKESLNTNATLLVLDDEPTSLIEFVHETAREIGVKFGPEEIVPDVLYCAAGRAMARVVECLVEDLVRSSFAKAWETNNGCPKILTLQDVRGAILNREEFDVFTNEGLGSRISSQLSE